MNGLNFATLSLLLVLGASSLMSEPSPDNSEGSIKDLYEYLLQREYPGPISYADHQIKRKAVRSPSLRLRFGRRSDPSMPVQSEDDDLIDQKSIRAPQLRLRFGRADPAWSSFEDNYLQSGEPIKDPSKRMIWGRDNEDNDDIMDQKSIRAPQLRLRFGRAASPRLDHPNQLNSDETKAKNSMNEVKN